MRKRLAGIYDKPSVRNRPATVPRLTIVRPVPIRIATPHARNGKTETAGGKTRRFCQLNFATCPCPRRRETNGDERRRAKTSEQRRVRKRDDRGHQTTWDKPAPFRRIVRRDGRGGTAARDKTRRKARRRDKTENETGRNDAERDEERDDTRRFCQLILSFRSSVYP